jgi:hypothetical protein
MRQRKARAGFGPRGRRKPGAPQAARLIPLQGAFFERAARMDNRVLQLLGAGLIVMAVLYVAVMQDASLCYQVAGCPTFRHVIFGY